MLASVDSSLRQKILSLPELRGVDFREAHYIKSPGLETLAELLGIQLSCLDFPLKKDKVSDLLVLVEVVALVHKVRVDLSLKSGWTMMNKNIIRKAIEEEDASLTAISNDDFTRLLKTFIKEIESANEVVDVFFPVFVTYLREYLWRKKSQLDK